MLEEEDLEKIVVLEDEISDEDLESIEEYIELAEDYLEESEFETALGFYELIIEMDPFDIDALNGKGFALDNLGSHEEAIKYFDEALEIDPSDIDALNGKAIALENMGELEEAIANLEKILEIDEAAREADNQFVPQPDDVVGGSSEGINDFDQTLMVIVGVFAAILASIIILDLVARKKKGVKKLPAQKKSN